MFPSRSLFALGPFLSMPKYVWKDFMDSTPPIRPISHPSHLVSWTVGDCEVTGAYRRRYFQARPLRVNTVSMGLVMRLNKFRLTSCQRICMAISHKLINLVSNPAHSWVSKVVILVKGSGRPGQSCRSGGQNKGGNRAQRMGE